MLDNNMVDYSYYTQVQLLVSYPAKSTTSTAPAKFILFGEHAVVYGHPSIACPLLQLKSTAKITSHYSPQNNHSRIIAPDINLVSSIENPNSKHKLVKVINAILNSLKITSTFKDSIHVVSDIPISSGLGSSASIPTAVTKALNDHLNLNYTTEQINEFVYETEVIQHGSPSGVDNTVIAYKKPILYQKDHPTEALSPPVPLLFIVANSGNPSSTFNSLNKFTTNYKKNKRVYDNAMQNIAEIVREGKDAFNSGDYKLLGQLMNRNHKILDTLGVTTQLTNILVKTSLEAGALGAKISGAGYGGNVVAITEKEHYQEVLSALTKISSHTLLAQIS